MSEETKQIDDGGPAFPVPPDSGFMDGNEGWRSLCANPGMSLRDYFAAHALIVACANLEDRDEPHEATVIARAAYGIADAMLAARRGGAQ